MKYLLTVSALFLYGIFSAFAQNVGSFNMQYNDNGTQRTFSMYVPEDYQASSTYTSILAIHGAGMAATFMRDWFMPNAETVSGILMCPDENDTWNGNVAVNTLNWTISNYNLNFDKMIASGFSAGGDLAMQLAWSNPDILDGIIVVNPFISSIPDNMKDNISKIPTAVILGTADPNYVNVKQVIQEIRDAGGDVFLIEKIGVEHADANYLPSQEFYDDWMECYTYIFGEPSDIQVKLQFPENNISNLITPTALNWKALQGASEYILELSDDKNFDNILMQEKTSNLYKVTSKLDDNSQYWWRVSTIVNGERKYTSKVSTFTTYTGTESTAHIYAPVEMDIFENEVRHFSVELPTSFNFSNEYNIILGMHGFNQSSDEMAQLLEPYTDYVNALVVCPSGNGNRHDDEYSGFEIEIAKEAVEKVRELLGTGDNDVYMVGFSYGGRETMYYGLEHHDYFKGIIGLSPAIQSNDDVDNNLPIPWPNLYKFENTTEIPVCILDGEFDTNFLPFISAFYSKLVNNGGHLMRYTFSDAGHDVSVSSEFDAKLKECFDYINMEGSLPSDFDLTQPDNNATDIMLDAELQWSAASGAEEYEIVLSTHDDLSNPINIQKTTDNAYKLSNLDELTTYYWQTRAINSYGLTAWSEIRSFTTGTNSSVIATEQGNITIYPVPADDYLNIDFSNQTAADASIEIFNSLGQRVYLNEDLNNLKLQINLIDFKAGQYSVRINLNGEVYNKSFIKM